MEGFVIYAMQKLLVSFLRSTHVLPDEASLCVYGVASVDESMRRVVIRVPPVEVELAFGSGRIGVVK